VWETDGDGFYDVQYVEGAGPDCRGRLYTREDGTYDFLAIKPVSYPISNDGPVGALLRALGRHWMRPAHMHFMIYHPEFNKLVTALYTRDDKYVTSDTGIQNPSIALTSSIRCQVFFDGGLQVDRGR
jgi:protocatechuate 3,4-dioxygenase beta subunit